jgi:hypothetical protein
MNEQYVIITKDATEINEWLAKGWSIKSVTAQTVATSSSTWLYGQFLIVLEKTIEML